MAAEESKAAASTATPAGADAMNAFYSEKQAAEYAGMMEEEVKAFAEDVGSLVKLLPATGAVVDASCGSGHLLAHVASLEQVKGRALHGVDISSNMLKQARTHAPKAAELQQGTMVSLPFEDGVAALVMNTFALHHVSKADAVATVTDAARVLAPGGVLYLAIWEGDGPIEMPAEMAGVVATKWPLADVKQWCTDAGMTVIAAREKFEDAFDMNSCYITAQKASTATPSS